MFENQLRITLAQTMEALQVSRRELKRMEAKGILVPIPRTDPRGRLFYKPVDVLRVAENPLGDDHQRPSTKKDKKKPS